MTPQVILTLAPDGSLVLERMLNGARQQIAIGDDNLATICKRILSAQSRRETRLGQDGTPTESQIKCWESHSATPNYFCAHCHQEGRISRRFHPKSPTISIGRNASVRRIPIGQKGKGLISQKSANELGL